MLLTDKIYELELQRFNFKVDTAEYASLTNKIIHYDSMMTNALINGGPYEVFENDYNESLRECNEISEQLDTLRQELTKIDLEPKIMNLTIKISNTIQLYDYYLKEIVNLREKFNEIYEKLSTQFNDLKRKRSDLLKLKSCCLGDVKTNFINFTIDLADIDDIKNMKKNRKN